MKYLKKNITLFLSLARKTIDYVFIILIWLWLSSKILDVLFTLILYLGFIYTLRYLKYYYENFLGKLFLNGFSFSVNYNDKMCR